MLPQSSTNEILSCQYIPIPQTCDLKHHETYLCHPYSPHLLYAANLVEQDSLSVFGSTKEKKREIKKKGVTTRIELTTSNWSKSNVNRRYYSRRIQSSQLAVNYLLYRGSGISLQPDYRVDLEKG
jgi:hypothetical protein